MAPEELASVLLEIIPSLSQSAGVTYDTIAQQLWPPHGAGYPHGDSRVQLALAEALSWLQTEGLLVRNPTQAAGWFWLTRRGAQLKTRVDIEAYRLGRKLPIELLQPRLAEKVHHLYVRGDHDIAVLQAFKIVEVAVRKACGYGNELFGRDLMQAAFHPENGPLRDQSALPSERQAEMFLFSGAIGQVKNPLSHRDLDHSRQTAARLIVFASHLLDIVDQREAA